MTNQFNYTYSTISELFENMNNIREKMQTLKEKGVDSELTINKETKDENTNWNLKLTIYNEGKEKSTDEIRVFNDRVGEDEKS